MTAWSDSVTLLSSARATRWSRVGLGYCHLSSCCFMWRCRLISRRRTMLAQKLRQASTCSSCLNYQSSTCSICFTSLRPAVSALPVFYVQYLLLICFTSLRLAVSTSPGLDLQYLLYQSSTCSIRFTNPRHAVPALPVFDLQYIS